MITAIVLLSLLSAGLLVWAVLATRRARRLDAECYRYLEMIICKALKEERK